VKQLAQHEQRRQRAEQLARLTAPQHIVQNRFTEHTRVEGYFQDRNVPDFYGCDRLWKMDTLYGTIQLGYDPRRGISFLFANIKTSIFDTAASAYQHNLWESSMMKTQKRGNQNLAYGSRRRENSATLLYKVENKPWSEASVAPYYRRVNLETLRKTMPFLDRGEQQQELQQNAAAARALQGQLRTDYLTPQAAVLRAGQMELLREREEIGAVRRRKQQQSLLFFRKINMAFDLQKAKMFDYYREERRRRALTVELVPPAGEDAKEKKPHEDKLHDN